MLYANKSSAFGKCGLEPDQALIGIELRSQPERGLLASLRLSFEMSIAGRG
jgi:hypothetical protein